MPPSERQLEITEQLARLDTRVQSIGDDVKNRYDQIEQTMGERFAAIDEKLERMNHLLNGNGTPGVFTRIDRLEQTEKRRGKYFWLLLGGIITLVSGTILHFVTR